MLGAIAGDIIGSVYEFANIKSTDFQLFSSRSAFTDDTVMSIAVADAIMNRVDYSKVFKRYGKKYPHAGYGGRFSAWLKQKSSVPYNSYGNGSAMRVSPVGFAFDTLDEVLKAATTSAACTHNHPEGIKGARAVAVAIYLARCGTSKKEIKDFIIDNFGYDLSKTLDEIRPTYRFDETCQGSVPQAITAFLESNDFEHAIRLAVSIGGDSDTIACITGGIAEAFYGGVPKHIEVEVKKRLTPDLLSVLEKFMESYISTPDYKDALRPFMTYENYKRAIDKLKEIYFFFSDYPSPDNLPAWVSDKEKGGVDLESLKSVIDAGREEISNYESHLWKSIHESSTLHDDEDHILTICALRFAGYEYIHSTHLDITTAFDKLNSHNIFPDDNMQKFVLFFFLQRDLFKWGGDRLSKISRSWRHFRQLFLDLCYFDPPIDLQGPIEIVREWNYYFKPSLPEIYAKIETIHKNTQYATEDVLNEGV